MLVRIAVLRLALLSGGTARRYRTDYIRRYGAGRIMRGDSVETVMHPYGYFDGTGRVRYQLHDYQGNVTMVVDEHGNVLQHTRYYPFGEAIDTFAASKVGALGDVATADATQPRLYGGKELERMHGLNEYDFSARRLPASLPQWTTPDPCLEQYYTLSPYAYCAANPLRYTDPSGCYFTYSSTEMILAFLSHLQTLKVASAINLKTQLQNIFTALKNGENVKGYVKNANIEIEKLQEFNNAVKEINILNSSNQRYGINFIADNADQKKGYTYFNELTNTVEMHIILFHIGLMSHELKHAYQFEVGEISFGRFITGEPFYDQTDEIAAYHRQKLISGESFEELPEQYQKYSPNSLNVQKYIDSHPDWPIDKMLKRLARNKRAAFRHNGITYSGIR